MILFLKSRGYHGILARFSVSVRVHGDAHGFSHHAGDLFGVSMEELVSGWVPSSPGTSSHSVRVLLGSTIL